MTTPQIPVESCKTVREAIDAFSRIVERQKGGDLAYWNGQKSRYEASLQRVIEIAPPPRRVLDIGSHYLHQAGLLKLLGYEVWGIDVETFAHADFLVERARILDISNTVGDIQEGSFLREYTSHFDLVIFTATLEHLTFNPVRFWRRVYEALAPSGVIYLTTPNAYRLAAWWRAAYRMISLQGIGVPVEDVLGTVTYGHHWKEYSAGELRQYFKLLSGDFEVSINWHTDDARPVNPVKRWIKRGAELIPVLRPDLEAIVKLRGKTGFRAREPHLPIQNEAGNR